MKKTLTAFAIISLVVSSTYAQQVDMWNVQVNNGNVNIQNWWFNMQVNNGNVNINQAALKLEWKITAAYKVTLRWNAYKVKDWEELLWYKLVISYIDKEVSWEWDKVVSLDADKTTTDDWNSKNSSMNYYKLYAVTNNGEIGSNVVVIPMDWNGKYDFSKMWNTKPQQPKDNQNMGQWNNQMPPREDRGQWQRDEQWPRDDRGQRGDMNQSQQSWDMNFQQQWPREGMWQWPRNDQGPRNDMWQGPKDGKGNQMQQQMPQQPNNWMLLQLLSTGLTQDQIKSIKEWHKALMDNTKKLVESAMASGNVNTGELIDSVLSLHKSYYDSLSGYIDEAKRSEFNAYVEKSLETVKQNVSSRIAYMGKNMRQWGMQEGDDRQMNQRMDNSNKPKPAQWKDNKPQTKKNILSPKLVKQVEDKLDAIPDANKAKVLDTLKTKINSLIEKLDSTNSKDATKVQLYKEVLNIVERKIEELNDSDVVNELLGSDLSTSTQQ